MQVPQPVDPHDLPAVVTNLTGPTNSRRIRIRVGYCGHHSNRENRAQVGRRRASINFTPGAPGFDHPHEAAAAARRAGGPTRSAQVEGRFGVG